jgi:hypothetical protein
MANYFSECNELNTKIRELTQALDNLRNTKDNARQNYLSELTRLIKSRPGLTASQYAALMSGDADERNSIQASISGMGYMADAHKKNWRTHPCCGNYAICANPSMPSLQRKQTMVKRRFIEVDENNMPIGTHETAEYRTVYSIEG